MESDEWLHDKKKETSYELKQTRLKWHNMKEHPIRITINSGF
jgi:hypothetical protein